jgi:hypothetical protein
MPERNDPSRASAGAARRPPRVVLLRGRRLASLASALVATALSGHALADEPPLTLQYLAPPECPTESDVRAAVARLVTKQRANPLSAQVTISAADQEYTAHIRPSDGSERVLTAPSCGAVVEAVEVVLALAISPTALAPAERKPEPRPSPTQPSTQAESVTSASKARTAQSAAAPTLSRFELGAGIAADTGTLPRVAAGLSGRLGLTARAWSALVDGWYWFPQDGYLPGTTTGGHFSWWTLRPAGCAAPLPSALNLELCAGPELGRINGHGIGPGLKSTSDAATLWLAADAWLEFFVPFAPHWRARLGAGAAIPLIGRHPFVLKGISQTVHRPDAAAGRGEVGVDFVF